MPSFEGLDLAAQVDIDRCCDEYQQALSAGNRQCIADVLSRGANDSIKRVMLQELLTIELEFSASQSRKLTLDGLQDLIPSNTLAGQDEIALQTLTSWSGNQAQHPDCNQVDQRNGAGNRATDSAPRSFGKYEFIERVGSGAFGEVWKARDTELDRIIAVKTPHRVTLAGHELERFRKEAQLAARLKHPNIVAVHEIVANENRHYIVADFIEGVSLHEWREQKKPSYAEITELFLDICAGLEHAHSKGVIHRDLKPTNIIVAADDRPCIADFGLAKGMGDDTLTIQGSPLGSPAYMSPEQARGDTQGSNPRTDIFAVGVMLYELLTDERPFRGQRDAVLHQVIHGEPTPPRKLNARIPIDLETICLKCLSKEPERRYLSAQELKKDFERFQSGKPIVARRLSIAGKSWRWMRRNPVLATISSIAITALLALAIGGPITAASLAQEIRDRQSRTYVSDMIVAKQALDNSNLDRARQILTKYEADNDLRNLRCFGWYYLNDQVSKIGQSRTVVGSVAQDMAVSPDGSKLAVTSPECVFVYDLPERDKPRRIPHVGAKGLAFHPNSLNVATSGDDGVRIWQVEDAKQLRHLPGLGDWSLAYSADGRYLASCGYLDSKVTIWDSEGETEIVLAAPGKSFYDVTFSPAENKLAATSFSRVDDRESKEGIAILWNLDHREDSSALEFSLGDVWGRQAAFSPVGSVLAVTTNEAVQIWDLVTSTMSKRLPYQGAESVAFSPDGTQLVSGGWLGPVYVWDRQKDKAMAFEREPFPLIGHSSQVKAIGFGPNGELYSLGKNTGEIICWGKPREATNALVAHHKAATSLAVSPDGKFVVTIGSEGKVFVTDVATQSQLLTVRPSSGVPHQVRLSPNGETFAVIADDDVLMFSIATGKVVKRVPGTGSKLLDLQFSPNGDLMATTHEPDVVRIHRLADGNQRSTNLEGAETIGFSPDGKSIAIVSGHDVVCLEASTLIERYRCKGHKNRVEGIDFSSQGILATCSRDTHIRLWRAATGELIETLPTQGNYVKSIAFSPDGKTLASGGVSRVKLWNMETLEEAVTLADRWGPVYDIEFSSKGDMLLAVGFDGTVRIWRGPK